MQMQPYESHIPFPLQIKIDLNLAGMNWLRLSEVRLAHSSTQRCLTMRGTQHLGGKHTTLLLRRCTAGCRCQSGR